MFFFTMTQNMVMDNYINIYTKIEFFILCIYSINNYINNMGSCHSKSKIPNNIKITSNNNIIHIKSISSPSPVSPSNLEIRPATSTSIIDYNNNLPTLIDIRPDTPHSSVNRYPTNNGILHSSDSDNELFIETPKHIIKPKLIIVPGLDELHRILVNYSSFISINDDKLLILLNDIAINYHNYPYHNLKHALIFTFNQIQFCHHNHNILLAKFNEYKLMSNYNKFFILFILAGLSHDIGHIGYTNSQLRDINHPWAIAHNNSPAEYFHANKFLEILSNHNISLDDNEKTIFTELILSTSLEIPLTIFNSNTIFKYIMRFADISHWCSNLSIHLEWYKRYLREINHRDSMYFDFFDKIKLNNKNASNQAEFSHCFFQVISYLNSNIPENDYMLTINKKFTDNLAFWNDKAKSVDDFFI